MASLVKNGNTYGLIWTDSSRDPKQVGESLKTDDYQKAKRRKARLEDQYFTIENGKRKHDPWKKKWYHENAGSKHIRLSNAIEKFILYKSKAKGQEGWGEVAQRNEKFTMRKFARFVGKNKLLKDVDKQDLEDFYYRDKVNSDHTRNSLYISVNTFLNWAKKEGYITEKPEYKPKKPQSKVPKFITIKQLATLIEEQQTDWVKYGWMILAGTGLRPKELSHLKPQHIEGDSLLIGEDFTTKVRAERRVPLLYEAPYGIKQLTAETFNREHAPEYLLGRKPGTTKQRLSREFTACWEQCFPNESKRTLYNLKDTFAVRFLSDDSIGSQSGMKLNELKEILGHSSLNTTQKYLKAVPFGTSLTGTIWDHLST